MIEKVCIKGYRKFKDVTFHAHAGANIFVGDNETGKSTILEAVGLVLTGRINGRLAQDELNPFWFNREAVQQFFEARKNGSKPAPPTITIEAFFSDEDQLQHLKGACNSESPVRDCPGLVLQIYPDADYADELELFFSNPTGLIPVEYYRMDWRSFADNVITQKPREVNVAVIDSRTIRSTSSIDYHLRQMLSDNLDPSQKTEISIAYRSVKEAMTDKHLTSVNEKLAELPRVFGADQVSLAMDQTSRSSWDAAVVPHLAEVPFAMSGQGQQAAIKIALAMGRKASTARIAMIEEPENHLSHASLNKLLHTIQGLSGDKQQLFITTHSSYVLNRLGLDALQLVSGGSINPISGVIASTKRYFQKLPGYDTLRIALARKIVLVEGPSDEILFERFFLDQHKKRPIEEGIDILSVRGLSFSRFLELAKLLGKTVAVVRDIDKNTQDKLSERYKSYLNATIKLFLGDPTQGTTLEPQIAAANTVTQLRKVLVLPDAVDVTDWMSKNKTEAAMRISESSETVLVPKYIAEAISFVHG